MERKDLYLAVKYASEENFEEFRNKIMPILRDRFKERIREIVYDVKHNLSQYVSSGGTDEF